MERRTDERTFRKRPDIQIERKTDRQKYRKKKKIEKQKGMIKKIDRQKDRKTDKTEGLKIQKHSYMIMRDRLKQIVKYNKKSLF